MKFDKQKAITLISIEVSESYTPTGRLKLEDCFNLKPKSIENPLNEYLKYSLDLRRYTSKEKHDHILANFLLLGHISLAEKYFRSIIGLLMRIDPISNQISLTQKLSLGAAMSLKKDSFFDVVLEDYTFSSQENIKKAIRECLGINSLFPDSLTLILNRFEIVCQLRHSIIHRHANFGSKNAISLEWSEHCQYIDNEIKIDFNNLEASIEIIDVCIRTFNDFMFSFVVSRQFCFEVFSGVYRKDSRLYKILFNSFKEQRSIQKVFFTYQEFLKGYKSIGRSKNK